MAAKLIFFTIPRSGRETALFCPLVKIGCDKCFFNHTCKGEYDDDAKVFRINWKDKLGMARMLSKKRYTLERIA